MSPDEAQAHKRTASSTSALQTTPPPSKRPTPAIPPSRRDFPHAVALVLHRDGGDDDVSSVTSVVSVHASLADANDEVRRLATEHLAPVPPASDVSPVRWDAPDGAACWVELHAVKPRSIGPRGAAVQTGAETQKKLYDAEEGEDPDMDDDEQDEEGHYD
ncbi:hypothetical protein CCHL11_06405 [Colletotrichum chlorophyti]|uniref:Uncharacterized protein n=1 Tax=Colletotrichum chlorophyti TaxID=708187 RepID=A0A1Q8RQD2_9PEZI|nr:hypothetical protein CCHL11_06405 [Colletotrichum chlorophyti]